MPTTPGVLSALGGLIADLKSDFIKTLYADLDVATAAVIRTEFAILKDGAVEWLRQRPGLRGYLRAELFGRVALSGPILRDRHGARSGYDRSL